LAAVKYAVFYFDHVTNVLSICTSYGLHSVGKRQDILWCYYQLQQLFYVDWKLGRKWMWHTLEYWS